jgi:predicted nucleic acid-binding protein
VRLLDTDVLIDVRRRYAPAVAWLVSLPDRPGVSGLVVMELIAGCRDQREVRALLREITPFRLYWPTEADHQRALQTYARGHLSHRLGLLDALIGECAVGLSATLATFNVRHFQAVPGLVTEQPYPR